MIIEKPDEIKDEFLCFLDVCQCMFTEDELPKMNEKERQVMALVESIVGEETASRRFDTLEDKQKAMKQLVAITNYFK